MNAGGTNNQFDFPTLLFRRARGYPEPIVTWRREDQEEIVLKDSAGVKQLGEICSGCVTISLGSEQQPLLSGSG